MEEQKPEKTVEHKVEEKPKVKEIVIPLKIPKLKGKNKFETVENFSTLFIIIGAAILSIGMGSAIFSTKGLPAILAMLGSFISFIATIILILTWLIKEFVGE
jgi:hypothetical protein